MSYRYAGKSKYRPQTVRKRQRRRIKRLTIFGLILTLLIVLICVITSSVRERRAQQQIQAEISRYADTFQPGVTINGTELTGLSYDEARQLLNEKYAASIEAAVELTFGERKWMFIPSQVGAQIDLDQQIERAWA